MSTNRRIFLDHAAATPVDPRVLRAMEPFWNEHYGNPSAIHREGVAAQKAVADARTQIADVLGVHSDEIIFTGSATESVNLALVGAVGAWQAAHQGNVPHIIVSAIEHGAVLEQTRVLEAEGVRVTRLPVDARGIIDLALLKDALTPETVLVSVMYANNEIGTIQPIKEIAKVLRKWRKEHRGVVRTEKTTGDARYPLFHTDASQAANYCDVYIPGLGVDLLTMNAAKIYGPKGIGLLCTLRDTALTPITVGGGQERGMRAGTENVPAIVGFAEALAIARDMSATESERLTVIRDRAIAELEKINGLVINGSKTQRLPNNINFSLPGIDHEFLAIALDARGFAVATKSACNELEAETSHVLKALREADGSSAPQSGIRLSLGRRTTADDIDAFILALKDVLATMFMR